VTRPEFFNQLEEGQEYLSLLCTKQTYASIDPLLSGELVINSVRQKNEAFRDDEQHKELVKKLRKSKKELQDYEYKKNNL
jgi:hypothetical protein